MKLTLYLLILFTILISCGKKQEIRITAVNPVNGEPWAGLHYSITQEKTGAFQENYKVIHEGFLDANGKAVTQVKMKNASYRIDIEDPGNTCYKNKEQYSFTRNDSNFDFSFQLAPCANLKFRYQNINCQTSSDSIAAFRVSQIEDYYGFYNPATYLGCTDYTIPNYIKVPMGWWYFDWSVTKNNITTNFKDSIFLNADEYRYYEFNY